MNTVPLTLKRLFSSKLRVKVLSHFFFHPGENFYIRHMASIIKEPPGTLARELSHLEKAGILKHELIGKQKHYSLRKDSPNIFDLRNIFLKTSGPVQSSRQPSRRYQALSLLLSMDPMPAVRRQQQAI